VQNRIGENKMDAKTYDELHNKILHMSLSELRNFMDQFGNDTEYKIMEISEQIEADAIFMIRKSEYMQSRCYHGLTHEKAVKKQNKMAAAIRKVLTYMVTHDVNF
jgi:hypothetical protein